MWRPPPKAKTGVKDAIVKYQKLLRQLNQKQTGPGAATHAKTQKAKQTALEKELKAQTARRVQAEKDVVTLRGQRKNKTAAQKTAIDRQIRAAKKDLRAEIKKEGSAQRKMHELYAYSVQKIVLNLKEDQKILAGFERAISGLKLTRP
jgi:predicted  nucleic acid-binding Zn-ribbon protein